MNCAFNQYYVVKRVRNTDYRNIFLNSTMKMKQNFNFFSTFLGQVFSQNLRNRMDLSSSTEGPDTEDNNYLGYSLAIGDFTGSGRADLAVGMPRSANLTGKVKS